MEEHDKAYEDHEDRLIRIERALFGDRERGGKGMEAKLDEMYDILIQAKGWKSLAILIIMLGGTIAVLKGFFIR